MRIGIPTEVYGVLWSWGMTPTQVRIGAITTQAYGCVRPTQVHLTQVYSGEILTQVYGQLRLNNSNRLQTVNILKTISPNGGLRPPEANNL